MAVLVACSGRGSQLLRAAEGTTAAAGSATAESGGGLTYNADIAPIVQARCSLCHTAGGIGPFTLTSYEDVTSHAAELAAAVQGGTMPPWPPAPGCQPYEFDISMTAGEQETLSSWLQERMVRGTGPIVTAAPAPVGGSVRADATLKMPAAYKPRVQPDEYRCFLLPWQETTTRYLTGSLITPGNAAIVHHAELYVSSRAASSYPDGADGFPGFVCQASPAGVAYTLTSWKPGAHADIYAADGQTGTPVAPGTVLVLQMHYHVEADLAAVQPDLTQVTMQLADSVAHQGMPVSIVDPLWVANPNSMLIPAGDPNVVHSYTTSPFFWWDYWTKRQPYTQLDAIEVSTHAHLLATSTHVTLQRGGQDICLLDIPRWSFHWQATYHLVQPLPLQPGDTVTVACQWDNSAANQPIINGVKQQPVDVVWGEDSDMEMCGAAIYMAPR